MEPEGSLSHSQVPATCSYREPARSSPYPYILLPEDPFYYHPPFYAWVSQVISFPQVSPTKTLYTPLFSPIRATGPAHLILVCAPKIPNLRSVFVKEPPRDRDRRLTASAVVQQGVRTRSLRKVKSSMGVAYIAGKMNDKSLKCDTKCKGVGS